MSKQPTIFLDHNSTTELDPKVKSIMKQSMRRFCGNPSSSHVEGTTSRQTLETCRQVCARLLGCHEHEMYFTSGATESNNIVLQGFIRHCLSKGHRPRILCSPIEHVSVLNPLRHFKDQIDLYECPVDSHGYVSPSDIEQMVVEFKIDLVTVAMVNHEIGTIQPIAEIARVVKRHGAFMHSDYTQAIGRFPIPKDVDSVSFSAHKFYGPPGVGGLVLKNQSMIDQITFGGDQEMKLRPGTENVLGVVGMTAALQLTIDRREKDFRHLDRLAKRLLKELDAHKIPYVLNSASYIAINLTFPQFKLTSDELLTRLSDHGVCVSKGAACKSRTKQESYVLAAIGVQPKGPTIRVGIGRYNKTKDIDTFIKILERVLPNHPIGRGNARGIQDE